MTTFPMQTNHRHLYDHQIAAVNQLKTGSILVGGVGSGKTITSLEYFFEKELLNNPTNLYVITTAKKRDSLDWLKEAAKFGLSTDSDSSYRGFTITVDSWNNIGKYSLIKDSFFIFDEQRLVGSGAWVKTFYKIAKNNKWILLSATPGDTWLDYIPVFIANGFYKNRSEFLREHVVFNNYITKFPKIDHYIGEARLLKLKSSILVRMDYVKSTNINSQDILCDYDKDKVNLVVDVRWNPFTDEPIKEISEFCYTLRRVVNLDPSRLDVIRELKEKHHKLIVFYNFNDELKLLRTLSEDFVVAEYNGHRHDSIPEEMDWIYLVQYISGSEGWNCIETNALVFFSLNYSYRLMTQAAGRIDRLNTPFRTLYYYRLISESIIDKAILKALDSKKNFNQKTFLKGGLLDNG